MSNPIAIHKKSPISAGLFCIAICLVLTGCSHSKSNHYDFSLQQHCRPKIDEMLQVALDQSHGYSKHRTYHRLKKARYVVAFNKVYQHKNKKNTVLKHLVHAFYTNKKLKNASPKKVLSKFSGSCPKS